LSAFLNIVRVTAIGVVARCATTEVVVLSVLVVIAAGASSIVLSILASTHWCIFWQCSEGVDVWIRVRD